MHRPAARFAVPVVAALGIASLSAGQPGSPPLVEPHKPAAAPLPYPPQRDPDGIHWHYNLAEAQRLSREQDRPLVAYYTFDACVWCKKLEADSFSEPSVIELSRAFVWVEINRDHVPAEVIGAFNVSAFPTLMVLGDALEKVYRFQSYMSPADLRTHLEEGLRRHALYRAGEPWDLPDDRPEQLIPGALAELLPAPSEGVPNGIAWVADSMWVAQAGDERGGGDVLYRLHPRSAAVLDRHAIRVEGSSIADLASDGELLYALTYGWTAGKPILVIDPRTGRVVREITTAANAASMVSGARGIAFLGDRLYLLEGAGGRIHELDTATGDVRRTIDAGRTWLAGLTSDGHSLIAGSRSALFWIDPDMGGVTRTLAVQGGIRSVGWHDDHLHLMAQPEFGYDTKHQRVRVWPTRTTIQRVRPPIH